MEKEYVLVLDCGTQSMRSIVFNEIGELLAIEKVKYPKYETNLDAHCEMNPEVFWDSAVEAVEKMRQSNPEILKQVKVITLASQRSTSVFVDKEGKPLRNAISWMDGRKLADSHNISKGQRRVYKTLGVWDIIDNYNRSCPYHWVEKHEPEVMENVHKLLFLSTYLNFKMTGEFKDSLTSAPGYIPFSNKRLDWATKYDIEGKVFHVKNDHLFELVQPGEYIGNLTSEAAEQFGLSTDIKVIAGGSDKACETIGVGCFNESIVSVSLASMVTVETTTDKYLPLYKYGTVYPSAIEGKYNPELGIARGFWLISWFIDEFGDLEKQESKEQDISIERLLNEKLKHVPPGSDGLLMHPYWMSDVRYPRATGTLIGLNDVHTRIHFYRALVEGLGYSIKEGIESIEHKTKMPVDSVGLSGGGSQSAIICQLLANILNKKVYVVQTHETTGLGAAMLGYIHLGVYKSVAEASLDMVHISKTYKPDPETADRYEELYKELYGYTNKRLQPVFDKIQELKLRK